MGKQATVRIWGLPLALAVVCGFVGGLAASTQAEEPLVGLPTTALAIEEPNTTIARQAHGKKHHRGYRRPLIATQAEPYVNFWSADRPVMPSRLSPNDDEGQNYNNLVRNIHWTSWGGETAEGTGEVSLLDEVKGSTSPVKVVLGGLENCAGLRVYTTYSLTLAPGAKLPKDWPEGQYERFPCSLSMPGGYAGQHLGRYSNCIKGLFVPTGERSSYSPNADWRPKPPGRQWFLCELRFESWGKSKAIGRGAARLGSHVVKGRYQWPMRIEFSHPIWCPASAEYPGAIIYSTAKIRLHSSDLANAGHHRLFVQRIKPSIGKCKTGWPEPLR